MTSKLLGIVALTAVLAPGVGHAIGFGELNLQSRIGESLRAEIPILTKDDEPAVTACFSLAPIHGADLPVITAAKTRLVKGSQGYILQIFGTKPINEPIFAIAVQAGCGYDVVRDYVLIPDAPFMLPEASSGTEAPTASTGGKPSKSVEWHGRDDISRQALGEDADAYIPRRDKGASGQKPAVSRPAQASRTEPPPNKPPSPRAKARPAPTSPAKRIDQLRLGAAPEGITPQAEAPLQGATEERLLRLETTLHLLTQEIEKMDQALELASQAIAAQEKLKLAETLPPTRQADQPTISAPPVPTHSQQKTSWLELLLSAALGAAITIGLAQYFGRRHPVPGEDQLPLALAVHPASHPPPHPAKTAVLGDVKTPGLPQTADVLDITKDIAAPPKPPTPIQALPEEPLVAAAEPAIVDITTEDEYSVLELAEIMLAFGRVRGAADTLAEYVEQNLPRSIQPWSMLLDLYRRGGMREEFEALAQKMHSRFNASIPAWSDSAIPISGLKALEDYPHIIQKAAADWGTQACLDYLFGLISDTRAGQRNGFPLEVVEEIVLLMRILEDGYGQKRAA